MTRREAPSWVSSSPSGASSAALKRVSIYSLTKGVGTEIVRDSDRRSTATTSSNHTLREEASISPSAFFSRRAQRSSAAGSGVGGGKPPGSLCVLRGGSKEGSKEDSKDSWSGSGGSGRA